MGDAAGGLWPEDLARFVGLCHAGSLAREASVGRGAGAREVRGVLRRGCKPKKLHEIARLADAVAEAAQRTGASTVVDFGSGAGYLGNVLAAEDGFDVVGVECEAHLNAKAERRGSAAVQWAARQRERGAKASLAAPAPAAAAGKDSDSAAAERQPPAHGPEGPPPGGSVAAVTALVGSGEDLDAVVAGCRDAVLTGLHTCGDLHASLLRIFLESSARGLVSVGCCYHRRTDVGEGQQPLRVFPLSRHVAALNVDLSSNVRGLGVPVGRGVRQEGHRGCGLEPVAHAHTHTVVPPGFPLGTGARAGVPHGRRLCRTASNRLVGVHSSRHAAAAPSPKAERGQVRGVRAAAHGAAVDVGDAMARPLMSPFPGGGS